MGIKQQLDIIKRGAVEIISEAELVRKLEICQKENRPLRVKAGFDPTAPDIHLGHTVLLRKMRQFQDLGHEVHFLIGDFTARIGDPTGKSQLRKTLTEEEVKGNAKTYLDQVSKILDREKIKVDFNSDWLAKIDLNKFLSLTMNFSVNQMLQREDFKERFKLQQNISILEFMYPIMQGYDSVYLKADIELGGTDQIFNLLVGREMQKDLGQDQQVVLTMPLLEGTDGINKMSKSLGNYIAINDSPKEMFGKIMSVSDELMIKYYSLLTDENLEEVKKLHPKEAKVRLAKSIIAQYHGLNDAEKAAEEFSRVFASKELPADMPVYKLTGEKTVVDICAESGLVKSKNETRRLIQQGALEFEGQKITDIAAKINSAGVLKIGSRRFLNILDALRKCL